MTGPSGRIDAYLVCGGVWHDFDFARLELLKLLAEDERVRVQVSQHYEDVEAITASDFLVTYTCDVRPIRGGATGAPRVGWRPGAAGSPSTGRTPPSTRRR